MYNSYRFYAEGDKGMKYLTEEEFLQIENLVNCAVSASDKVHAKRYINHIRHFANGLEEPAAAAMNELIAKTDAASGRVKEKERLEAVDKMSLCKLHRIVTQAEKK